MPEVNINGIEINFPFEPYKVQYDYMHKVIECLQKGENGLLESPTGTGKTLSLLCSSIAWHLVKKAQIQASAQGYNIIETKDGDFVTSLRQNLETSIGKDVKPWCNIMMSPKIIYASRTHSQLSQVVAELKRTNYSHVKVAVLGSRDQMCVHPEVMKESSSSAKIIACQLRVSARSCHYYNNVESKKSDPKFTETIMDIEDITKVGKNMQCCPYYLTRELQQSADIIFMPYNYLLDVRHRKALDIQLSNSVVILDEGHNVEKMCEESASIELSSTDIALCITEVTQVMKKVHDQLTNNMEGAPEHAKDFTLEDLCILKTLFLELEKSVTEISLDRNSDGMVGKHFKGSYIFEFLAKSEITEDKINIVRDILLKVSQFLQTTSESPLRSKGSGLQKFSEFLQVVFASKGYYNTSEVTDSAYKVYIEPETKNDNQNSWSKTSVNKNAKIINFWCFSPGFGMRSLLEQGTHSVIITSGTLSPLQATITELGIPIKVQLENPHIIKPEQICVTIIKKGPGNKELNSSYRNREQPEYLQDLGQTLLNYARQVPDGFLVFFPSYQVMKTSVDHWQQSGQWSKISEIKPIFVEPKEKENFNNIMSEYYNAIKVGNSRGAIMLAVCRGKISEGLDFADARGRAVMVTGLPYAPFKNPRVVLKREYIDQNRKTNNQALTGAQWYDLEAIRAVNQAIGRVIRHGNDYGTVILCDERFDRTSTINTLSAWLRPHITTCNTFGPSLKRIITFFRTIGDVMPTRSVNNSEGGSFDYAVDIKTKALQAKKEDEENQNKARNNEFKTFLEQMKSVTPSEKRPFDKSQGLFEALNSNEESTAAYNPLTATAEVQNLIEIKDQVQPDSKKRKLKLVPLKFYNPGEQASSSESLIFNSSQSVENYLLEVKRTLDSNKYAEFQFMVKNYRQTEDYSIMVSSLAKIFSNKEAKPLLPGFHKFVKLKDRPKFEDFISKLYKT